MEQGNVGAQGAVEPVGLQADFKRIDGFGEIGAKRRRRRRASVEAARPEPGRIGAIDNLVVADFIGRIGAPGEFSERRLARTIGRRSVSRQSRQRPRPKDPRHANARPAVECRLAQLDQPDDLAVIVEGFLFVAGIAPADRQFKFVAQRELRVGEAGIGGGLVVGIGAQRRSRGAL